MRASRWLFDLAILTLLFISHSAFAQGSRKQSIDGVGIYLEEDAFYPPSNEDRNYTAGFGFSIAGSAVDRLHLNAPLLVLDKLIQVDHRIHHRASAGQEVNTFQLSGSAFTPDSLASFEPVVDDRPYASIITLSSARTTVDLNERAAWTSEFATGVLGLHIARNIQRYIHDRSRARSGKSVPVDPKGWPNQISDGGEPTAKYSLSYQRLVFAKYGADPRTTKAELTVGGRGDIGYYTELSGSATFRLGRVRSKFWEFRSNPLSGVNKAPTGFDWDLFVLGAARPRLVGYNALLQGQFRHSNYTMPASMLERGVLEYETGISGMLVGRSHAAQLTFLYPASRTAEFNGPYKRRHDWASVFITFR